METRTLATVLVTLTNRVGEAFSDAAAELEKMIAADTDGDARTTRRPKDEDDEKPARRSRARKDKDEEEEKDEDDEPTEDDVVDAVRAAQKVVDRNELARAIKKYGKAERSKDVKPENRAALLKVIEKLVEEAE